MYLQHRILIYIHNELRLYYQNEYFCVGNVGYWVIRLFCAKFEVDEIPIYSFDTFFREMFVEELV